MFFCCWLAYAHSHIVGKYSLEVLFLLGPSEDGNLWVDHDYCFLLSVPFSFVFYRIHERLNAADIRQN